MVINACPFVGIGNNVTSHTTSEYALFDLRVYSLERNVLKNRDIIMWYIRTSEKIYVIFSMTIEIYVEMDHLFFSTL